MGKKRKKKRARRPAAEPARVADSGRAADAKGPAARRPQKKGKAQSPAPAGTTGRPRWLLAVPVLFACLLYGATLGHEHTLDDDIVNARNSFVARGTAGIGDILTHGYLFGFNGRNDQSYRPLTLISFALERQLFGLSPAASHAINVVIYALTGLVLLLLLELLFAGHHRIVPLAMTLVYLAHPVHTEVIASAKSRDEALCFLFVVLALLGLARHLRGGRRRHLLAGIACYFLALLSKEVALPMLLAFPLAAYVFLDQTPKRAATLGALFAAPVGLYFAIRAAALDTMTFDNAEMDIINNTLAAAGSTTESLATNFVILARYLGLLVVPYPLSFDYSYNQIPIVGWSSPLAIAGLVLHLALGGYAVVAIRRRDPLAFAILFYLLGLSISSNLFIKIGATLGERFLYTPSLGFAVALVWLAVRALRVDPRAPTRAHQIRLLAVIAPVVLIFAALTVNRSLDWKDNATLFEAGVEACPGSARCHSAMGSVHRTRGEAELEPTQRREHFERAVESYQRAVKIYPGFGEAQYNLGVSLQGLERSDEALVAYQAAVKADPGHTEALNNIGTIHFDGGDLEAARTAFERVLQLNPRFASAVGNLGAIRHRQGDLKAAVQLYEKALAIDPGDANVLKNLGIARRALSGR